MSTDADSLAPGQDEFCLASPHNEMDLALWHFIQQLPAASLAESLAGKESKAEAIYGDIDQKRRPTALCTGRRCSRTGDRTAYHTSTV